LANWLLSDKGRVRRVVVIGGGIAGASAALGLCEARVPVLLVSSVGQLRAHSVCQRGGFGAASARDDSSQTHFEDTIIAGDFLAHEPPVRAMTQRAPELLAWLERLGVPFDRTAEGLLQLLRSAGTSRPRSVHAGAVTGQQILYALWAELRRFTIVDAADDRGTTVSGARMLELLEYWDFMGLVRDDNGVSVGVVLRDQRTLKIKAVATDGVCLASGDAARLYSPSTASLECTGAALASAFRQGAVLANPEFVQYCPTAALGQNKAFAVAEAVRADGARLWVPRDPKDRRKPGEIPDRERDYFLERLFPASGNLTPDDLACRAMCRLFRQGGGVWSADRSGVEPLVYLDASHVTRLAFRERIVVSLEPFSGADGVTRPLRVAPAAHHMIGGIWVDYEASSTGTLVTDSPRNQATSISGLYAAGDVQYQYHGASRSTENALLGCLHSGLLAASAIASYRGAVTRSAHDLPGSLFEKAEAHEERRLEALVALSSSDSPDNGFAIAEELGRLMDDYCGPERDNDDLDNLMSRLDELDERARAASISDRSAGANRALRQHLQLPDMLLYARVVALSARRREESRGCHYKAGSTGWLGRDDVGWRRTTLAVHDPTGARFVPEVAYECAGRTVRVTDAIDAPSLAPSPRDYARGET
jgi:succinate dehydrogenase / fumarate reductase flavoprotein subunit